MQTNAHQTGKAHCDGAPAYYDRHRPKQTTLYRLVQQHAASFIVHTEASTGSKLTAGNLPFVVVGFRCISDERRSRLLDKERQNWGHPN